MRIRYALRGIGLFMGLLVLAGASANGSFIVVPQNLEFTEGNQANAFPFGADGGTPTQRYQQVYAASQFTSLSGPALITQITFRPDAVFGASAPFTITDVHIHLSTTSAAPDVLSTTFANNLGLNDLAVYSGPLTLGTSFTGPAPGPKNFDIVINLQQQFLYDRTAGNLLLDVRRTSSTTSPTAFFDSQVSMGDSISRVFTNNNTTGGGSSSTGIADTEGLITRFTTVPVPEPAAWISCLWGAFGFLRSRLPKLQ